MTWDDDKSTFRAQPGIPDDEKLTAPEWNDMVADQTARGYNAIATPTSAYTASAQEAVFADTSGGGFTVTLPDPDAAVSVAVKKVDASGNTLTIATPGSQTIDGDSERTVTGDYASREIMSDGTNYWII